MQKQTVEGLVGSIRDIVSRRSISTALLTYCCATCALLHDAVQLILVGAGTGNAVTAPTSHSLAHLVTRERFNLQPGLQEVSKGAMTANNGLISPSLQQLTVKLVHLIHVTPRYTCPELPLARWVHNHTKETMKSFQRAPSALCVVLLLAISWGELPSFAELIATPIFLSVCDAVRVLRARIIRLR
jgi:hypothetical protein